MVWPFFFLCQPTLTFSLATHPLLSFFLSKLESVLTFLILPLAVLTLVWLDLQGWVKGSSVLRRFASVVPTEVERTCFPQSFSFKAKCSYAEHLVTYQFVFGDSLQGTYSMLLQTLPRWQQSRGRCFHI